MQNKFNIPNGYLAYNHIDDINQIAKPLFDRYGIILIDFARIYYDASWLFFTNQIHVTQFFFDVGSNFLPNTNIKKQQSFCFVSTVNGFQEHLSIIREDFFLDNFIAYIDKCDKYVDVYWFGTTRNQAGVMDFYLNNLDIIKNYADFFKNKAQDLIQQAEKNRIIIPSVMKNNYQTAFKKIKQITNLNEFYFKNDQVHLTAREMVCLKLVSSGYSAKMIAKKLSLSVRTIETHIDNIKRKLKCTRRDQLIEMAFDCLRGPTNYFD